MKTIALTLFAAVLGFAQSQSSSSTTTTPPPKAAAKAATTSSAKRPAPSRPSSADQKARAQSQTQSIPADAAQIEPNLYRYADSNGKIWMYRQTPFGISKWEEGSTPAPTAAKSDPVAVTDLGDSVRFEKKTPFGGSSWVRKKTELNDEEKALVAGANSADKTKEDK